MKKFIKPISSIRRKSTVEGRFALREEVNYKRYFVKYVFPFYIAFFFIDWIFLGFNPLLSLSLRMLACLLSYTAFYFFRGRLRYISRAIVTCCPFYFVVGYIGISSNSLTTPYSVGYALIAFTNVVFFPSRMKIVFIQQTFYQMPQILFLLYGLMFGNLSKDSSLFLIMNSVGLTVLTMICGEVSYREIQKRYLQYRLLESSNRNKSIEIEKKIKENSALQTLKNQLSPEVAKYLIHNQSLLSKRVENVVIIVCDIKDSTNRSFELPLEKYDKVVEETLEIFVNACARFGVTVDKYIGDGVQAVSGAPVSKTLEGDLTAAFNAIRFSKMQIDKKKGELESLWKEKLEVKFSATFGPALVGFHGRSSLQNYTATGRWVSLAHRICGLGSENEIAFHNGSDAKMPEFISSSSSKFFDNIKGMGLVVNEKTGEVIRQPKVFEVFFIDMNSIQEVQNSLSIGTCKACVRPLFLGEDSNGLPIAYSNECAVPTCQYILRGQTRLFI
jgi:adenylate cyclase